MLETDVKIFKSEKMNLTDDSGGRRSNNVIPYGQENSIFPDISQEARNRGKNMMAKIWGAVTTEDTQYYQDVVAIVSRIPADDNVSVTIFKTPDATGDDKVTDARRYLEQGIVTGGQSPYFLYGLHNAGGGAITVWCRAEFDPPDINSTLILFESEQDAEQSVRISRVLANSVQNFSDSEGQFSRRVISIQLSAPLQFTFHGSDVRRNENSTAIKVTIYNAVVSDSTRIYGTSRLQYPAAIEDLQLSVESLNARVIPSNISYLPATDLNAAGEAIALQDAGGTVSLTVSFSFGPAVSLYLGAPCIPGSLSISVPSGELSDDGGDLKSGVVIIGAVDYAAGLVTFSSNSPTYSGSKTISFTPAVPVSRVQNTFSIQVTSENRGKVFTTTLSPPPAPTSLRVAYLSGGKWYTLRDFGNSAIGASNSAYGTGQVNYATGSTTITLGALPDNYSSIIFTWAVAADTFNRRNITPSDVYFELILAQAPVNTTVSVSWGDVSVTDDASGNLTGDGGTGIIFYGENRIRIYPTVLPQIGQTVTVSYEAGPTTTYNETFNPIPGPTGQVELTLAHDQISPGSVLLKYPIRYRKYIYDPAKPAAPIPNGEAEYVTGTVTARDNAVGGWIGSVGAMSYGDGTLIFEASGLGGAYTADYDFLGWIQMTATELVPYFVFSGWTQTTSALQLESGGAVTVSYRTAGATTSETEVFSVTQLFFDLTNEFAEPIAPGSVRFSIGAAKFDDYVTGSVWMNRSTQTGSATLAGTLDYQTGIAALSIWPVGSGNAPTIAGLMTRLTATAASTSSFRTAGAPIQTGQLSLRVNKPDGTVLTGSAQNDGRIVAAGIEGTVDFQVGVVNVGFGSWVVAAGNEQEPWYDANAIRQDGKIFRPEPVLIDTLTYSTVAIRYLPIEANSLGVDPTRFPPDGLMPIYHIGDTLIVHHTQSMTLPNPLQAGSTLDCGRTHVTWISVVDSEGAAVPSTGRFSLNSEAGIVTVSNPLDLSGFVQPLTLYHTIADRSVITDLDIAGVITFSKPLRHNYGDGTLVSSAMQLGTFQADWSHVFSQQAWQNTWQDERQGNPILAQYNYTQFPPVVTNYHTTRQRYVLIFKNNTQFDAYGESLGYIGSGDKNTDFKPTNLSTGGALFELKALGIGSNWNSGNALRMNTEQVAEKAIWCLMSLNPSDPAGSDQFEIRILGDQNA